MRREIEANLKADIERAKANYENEIAMMTEQAEKFEKDRLFYKGSDDLYCLYRNYIDVGFTDEQAWELIKILVSKGVG